MQFNTRIVVVYGGVESEVWQFGSMVDKTKRLLQRHCSQYCTTWYCTKYQTCLTLDEWTSVSQRTYRVPVPCLTPGLFPRASIGRSHVPEALPKPAAAASFPDQIHTLVGGLRCHSCPPSGMTKATTATMSPRTFQSRLGTTSAVPARHSCPPSGDLGRCGTFA